jgi:hypothetical protein
MQLSNYRVALVISKAGLNAAQLIEVKSRLKFIAKMGGAEPDGITLTLPAFKHKGPDGAAIARRLVTELARLDYVRIEVREHVLSVNEIMRDFHNSHDEVWCISADRQSKLTKSRAWFVYDEGKKTSRAAQYKLIPPWVEVPVTEAKTKAQPKALKG